MYGRYPQFHKTLKIAGKYKSMNMYVSTPKVRSCAKHICGCAHAQCRLLLTDLQYVAPDVVPEGPAQAVQNVQHLLLLEHREEAVEEDLEPDGHGLGAVQHQAADVEHHVGLNDLHLGRVVQVLGAELVQSCVFDRVTGRERGENAHTEVGAVND